MRKNLNNVTDKQTDKDIPVTIGYSQALRKTCPAKLDMFYHILEKTTIKAAFKPYDRWHKVSIYPPAFEKYL